MDGNREVREGWRVAAARALNKDRVWIGRCAEHLRSRGLIETAPRARYAKVLVENITG